MNDLFDNFYFGRLFYTVILVLISFSIIKSMRNRNIDIKKKLSFKNIDYKFILKLSFFYFLLNSLLDLIDYFFNISMADSMDKSIISLFVLFMTDCLIAPFTEEIIFRFGLYELLKTKINTIISIILTSIIFSVIHGYNIYATLYLFVLAVIWNYSYYKKDNLIYPIILHFLLNIIACISYINTSYIFSIIFGIACLFGWLILEFKRKSR